MMDPDFKLLKPIEFDDGTEIVNHTGQTIIISVDSLLEPLAGSDTEQDPPIEHGAK
jgi:hypothetical protein